LDFIIGFRLYHQILNENETQILICYNENMSFERATNENLDNGNLDVLIELALEHEERLLQEFFDLGGRLDEESEEWEYLTVQEANVGKDRRQALQRLNEFLSFLEDEIKFLKSPNPFFIGPAL
jgi:hypothetical protein